MLIGTMNHPEHNVLDDISRMADLGMEFVDLTLEPPGAASWNIDAKAVRVALQRYRMPVVGHTRVLPQLLADTRKLLAEAWPAT